MNREELKKLTIKELKAKCKELGLSGYSRKKEDELINMILEATSVTQEVPEMLKNDEMGIVTNPVTDNVKEKNKVVFIKLIDNVFWFKGREFKDREFTLTKEEAKHPVIKTALKAGLIKIK